MVSGLSVTRFDEPPISNDWTLAFTHHLTREASSYWERCRGNRLMPLAQDLSPRGMKTFITHAALIGVCPRPQGGADFRVRLAGESTKRVFGNITNKSLREFLPPEGERRWRLPFEAVLVHRARLRNHGTVSFEGKQWLDFETLVAPLGNGIVVTDLLTVFLSWPRNEF